MCGKAPAREEYIFGRWILTLGVGRAITGFDVVGSFAESYIIIGVSAPEKK